MSGVRPLSRDIMRCPACEQIVGRRARKRRPTPVPHQKPDGVMWCKGYLPVRKGWSVKDADHIPVGQRVMITANLPEHFASWTKVAAKLGIPGDVKDLRPFGKVRRRYFRTGSYDIVLEGATLGTIVHTAGGTFRQSMTSSFSRDQLIWPIPEGVIAFDPAAARARRARRRGP